MKLYCNITKLFLQVFDEGYMTTSTGEIVDFSHTIIFMTSNLGSDKKGIGFSKRNNDLVMEKIKNFLGVELLNRIDRVVFFKEISEVDIEKIIHEKLTKIVEKNNSKNLLSPEIVNKIKNESNYLEFGARKIDKIIDSICLEYDCFNR